MRMGRCGEDVADMHKIDFVIVNQCIDFFNWDSYI